MKKTTAIILLSSILLSMPSLATDTSNDKSIQSSFQIYTKAKARHILLKTRKEAEDIIKILNKSKSLKAEFIKQAKKKSIGPSSVDGGYIGWFNRDKMVREFSDATFSLEEKSITKTPIKTPFGYHVIYLEEKKVATDSNNIKKNYYKSGELKIEVSYKNGKPNGLAKTYYKSGKVSSTKMFKDGKKNGLSKTYYETGELNDVMTYKNNKREGLAKEYFKSGKLKRERRFNNDKLNGLSKVYYESGQLWDETNFKDGKVNGIRRGYDKLGKLINQLVYKNGLLIQ